MKKFSIYSELEQLLTDIMVNQGGSSTKTRTKKTETEYMIELSVPGCSKDDLTIKTENGVLYVSNEKQSFFTNVFKRQYDIPDDVDTENISAEFKDGVLVVILPIVKHKAPIKTITIK